MFYLNHLFSFNYIQSASPLLLLQLVLQKLAAMPVLCLVNIGLRVLLQGKFMAYCLASSNNSIIKGMKVLLLAIYCWLHWLGKELSLLSWRICYRRVCCHSAGLLLLLLIKLYHSVMLPQQLTTVRLYPRVDR